MSTSEITSRSIQIGPGFCGSLTIVLLILKCTGYIACSWWWVFAPLWMPVALAFGVGFTLLIIGLILLGVGVWSEER